MMKRLLIVLIAIGILCGAIHLSPRIPPQVVKLEVEGIDGDTWQGTGFFVADDVIVTAGHMVEDANSIIIVYPNGDKRTGYDWYQEDSSIADVGIVRVRTPKREPTVPLVDCRIGDDVIAIGDPYGHFPVTTRGHISGLNIDEDYFGEKNLILVDVALNPGNSGCPIIGRRGVVAICVGGIDSANNMCFCVPANIVRLVLDKYWAIERLKEAA